MSIESHRTEIAPNGVTPVFPAANVPKPEPPAEVRPGTLRGANAETLSLRVALDYPFYWP
jgi:hypothetical protein